MNYEFKSIIELSDYYKDNETCLKLLEQQRWNGKPCCPSCGKNKVYILKNGYKCANRDCYRKFSVVVGTIFENSKIPLRKWFIAIYLITAHKKGISSYQLSRDLRITQKTAWFMEHRIREMLYENNPALLSNEVEVDETFIGGKNKNKHYSKRKPNTQGRSVEDKTPVMGLLERNGKLAIRVIENTKGESLIPVIESVVKKDSNVFTDEWPGYNRLRKHYKHKIVNHGSNIYVLGNVHTQNIEGFWSILKRGIYGVYHQVSKKHLPRYCNEFCFRYNTREVNSSERFNSVLKNANRRLSYRDLINA